MQNAAPQMTISRAWICCTPGYFHTMPAESIPAWHSFCSPLARGRMQQRWRHRHQGDRAEFVSATVAGDARTRSPWPGPYHGQRLVALRCTVSRRLISSQLAHLRIIRHSPPTRQPLARNLVIAASFVIVIRLPDCRIPPDYCIPRADQRWSADPRVARDDPIDIRG